MEDAKKKGTFERMQEKKAFAEIRKVLLVGFVHR
jgi:hypothetical protein